MNKHLSYSIGTELLWWVLALIITTLVMLPIYNSIIDDYLWRTAVMALLFVKFFRFSVLLKTVPYLQHIAVKIGLIVISVPVIFIMLLWMQKFFLNADHFQIGDFIAPAMRDQNANWQANKFGTFKTIFLFLLVGCLVLPVVLDLRLIGSMWKSKRK